MAVPIGNLIRKIDTLGLEKADEAITIHIANIRKAFDKLQPYVHDAERKSYAYLKISKRKALDDLQPYVHDAERKRYAYLKISEWVLGVAALATEVYDIMVSYTWHLCNTKVSSSFYTNLYHSRFFTKKSEDVSEKIQRFLDRVSQSRSGSQNQSSTKESPIWSRLQNYWQSSKQDLSSNEMVPFLTPESFTNFKDPEQKSSWESRSLCGDILKLKVDRGASYTQNQSPIADSIYNWRKLVPGTDLAQLYERFSKEVIENVEVLIRKAVKVNIQSDRESLLEPNALLWMPIQTILESRKINVRAEEQTQIESWLKRAYQESNNIVIGITGSRGIGKTYLADEVHKRMHRYYDTHAWVPASRGNKRSLLEDVLKGILRNTSVMVPGDMNAIQEVRMKEMIKRRLSKSMFLLILDDIQKPEVLKDVMGFFPNDSKVSIVCTSQKQLRECTHVIKLMGLNCQNSRNLLERRVTGKQESGSWWSENEAASDTLTMCEGNPFAIATIGGMQSAKKESATRWLKINNWAMDIDFIPMSYADLKPVLKSCFLYTASFPCHTEISRKKLQRLWIAEGFVEVGGNTTLEEAAKIQLDELIQRNMIHVARLSPDGCVKTCRLLKPMRDFALGRSGEDQLCTTTGDYKKSHELPKAIHQIFLHKEGKINHGANFDKLNLSRLYSFLAFKGNGEQKKQQQHQLFDDFSHCRHLSVLELKEVPGNNLPDAIGDLSLLLYLGLRGTKITKVPTSLKKLKRLQTLDIRNTFVKDLPENLDDMTMLRHLLLNGSFSDNVVGLNSGIEAFKNLQTLAGIKLTDGILKGLSHLPLLQKLSVGNVKKSHSEDLFHYVEQMKFLRSLTIKCSFMEEVDMFTCKPHENLEKVVLGGCAKNVISWVSKSHALRHLYLWDSNLSEDPFPALEQLPNLLVLSLCNAYDGETIGFSPQGFPSLKKLSILHCRRLKKCKEIGKGAMEKLQMLVIAYCPNLSNLPEGISKLTSLEALQVSNMSEDFIKEARDTHLTLGTQFSLHIQDPAQLPERKDKLTSLEALHISNISEDSIDEDRNTNLTQVKQYSVYIQDPAQLPTAQVTKRLHVFNQGYKRKESVVEPLVDPASFEDAQILGKTLYKNIVRPV